MSLYRLCIPSGGELLSALVAASLDDVATALGLHALSESVDLAALTLFGLECPFHISDLSGLFVCVAYPNRRDRVLYNQQETRSGRCGLAKAK